MKKIIHNKIRCKNCGDIIESNYTHDFKWCKCHSVAVDGGHNYCKRSGKLDQYEDLSEFEYIEDEDSKDDDKDIDLDLEKFLYNELGLNSVNDLEEIKV